MCGSRNEFRSTDGSLEQNGPGAAKSLGSRKETVTLKLQVTVRPAPSVAVYVTGVVPMIKVLPGAGPAVCVMEAPVQLSETVGTVQDTMELSVKPLTLMSPGQPEITGGRIS